MVLSKMHFENDCQTGPKSKVVQIAIAYFEDNCFVCDRISTLNHDVPTEKDFFNYLS